MEEIRKLGRIRVDEKYGDFRIGFEPISLTDILTNQEVVYPIINDVKN